MQAQQFVFGWVDATVRGNYAAWSSWKSKGTEEDAEAFWKKTVEEAEEEGGLEWFQVEIESED